MFGTLLSGFEIVLVAIVIYLLVYGLINRICKCLENRAMYKAMESMSADNFEKFLQIMRNTNNGKNS